MNIKSKLNPIREKVFISYSHKDKKWLERIQTMLKPLVRDNKISLWADTNIQTGKEWREEIRKALASAKIALLLVSPDFLASDYIAEHELPPLLDATQKEGVTILWIPVRSSMYTATAIERYQAAISPEKPLAQMRGPEQEKTLVGIGELINRVANSVSDENIDMVGMKKKPDSQPKRTRISTKKKPDRGDIQDALVPAFAPHLVKAGNELQLINIGNSTAIGIEIDPVNLQFESLPEANLTFEKVMYIRPGEDVIVKHTSRFGEEPTGHGFGLDWLFHLRVDYAKDRVFALRIQFQDILGKRYMQIVEMGAVACGCKLGPVEMIYD